MLDPLNWFCIPLNGSWPLGLKPVTSSDFTPVFLKFRMWLCSAVKGVNTKVISTQHNFSAFYSYDLFSTFFMRTGLWRVGGPKSRRFRILQSQVTFLSVLATALPHDIKLFQSLNHFKRTRFHKQTSHSGIIHTAFSSKKFLWELILYLTNCQLGSDIFSLLNVLYQKKHSKREYTEWRHFQTHTGWCFFLWS